MLSDFIEILILSLIQGVTEFLPISSSAHLIIISSLYEFKSNSLLIDISLHLGSLLAILFYFRNQLLNFQSNQKVFQLIIMGSIPIIFVGYILYITNLIYLLRDIKIIAWTTLIFAVILFIADKNTHNKKIEHDLNLKTIFFIGSLQIFALIPGVSRAGIAITAGRLLKFDRVDSSKISFLLSIPALTGASLLSLKDILKENLEFSYIVLIAIILSFLFSYFTVRFFLKYISKFSMNIFVFYRIIIAVIIFALIYN